MPAAELVVSAVANDKTAMPVLIDLRSPAARTKVVELRLVDCVHVRGIVSDGSGAPIARVHVAPDIAQIPFAETDALGHFDLCAHSGPQEIRFAASGYQAVLVDLRLSGNDILDVTLLPEAVVAGTVVDSENRPVAGAAITIDPRGKHSLRDEPVISHGIAPDRPGARSWRDARGHRRSSRPCAQARRSGRRYARSASQRREHRAADLHRVARESRGHPGGWVRAPRGTSAILIPHFQLVTPREVTIADKDVTIEITASSVPDVTGIVTRGGAPAANAVLECPMGRRGVSRTRDRCDRRVQLSAGRRGALQRLRE